MDSQERHDLKENDIAAFFQNFGEWWEKWGNTVLVIAVVLLGGVAIYRFVTYQSITRHDDAWSDLAATTSPEGYQTVAQSHGNEAVTALAYLRGAELYHQRAMETAAANIAADDGEDAPTAEADLKQAAQMYQSVLETSRHPVYRANALLGLAAVAESQRDWTAAADYYTQVAEVAGEAYPELTAQAEHRRGLLDDLQRPVAFGPDVATPRLEGMTGSLPGFDFNPLDPNAGSAFPADQAGLEELIRTLGGSAAPAVTDEPTDEATSETTGEATGEPEAAAPEAQPQPTPEPAATDE